jgi:ELWxxDGT repeat protein
MLTDIHPGGGAYDPGFTVNNGKLYFQATDNTSPSLQLWATDGTVAGTTKLTDSGVVSYVSYPLQYEARKWQNAYVSGELTDLPFGAATLSQGSILWTSDGTAAGTGIWGAGTYTFFEYYW